MENNENDRGFKSLENKIADGYYSTNENDGQEEVCQVKFDGDTLWSVKAKLKYGEVRSSEQDANLALSKRHYLS